jgi:hypothetical protein
MGKYLLACALVSLLGAQTPVPGQQSRQTRQGRRGQPQTGISDLETPVATFHGTLRSINKKEVVLDMPEDQTIAFHISHKTKFVRDAKAIKPSAIPAGAPVTVDGKRDLLGNVEAVTVTVDSSKKPPEGSKPPEPATSAAPPR